MVADLPAAPVVATMRRWMLAVGVLLLVLGVGLLPWPHDLRTRAIGLDATYAGGDLATGDPAYRYVLDWAGVFGLSLLVLGAVLLWAARRPQHNRSLAVLVIWHELGVGIVGDAWFISRDHVADTAAAVYTAFIVLHLAIAVTGLRALRRTPRPESAVPPLAREHAGADRW